MDPKSPRELSPPPARFGPDPDTSAEEAIERGVATLRERTYIRLMRERNSKLDDARNRRTLRLNRTTFLDIAFARYYRQRDACERHRPSGRAPRAATNTRVRGGRRTPSRAAGGGSSGSEPPDESDLDADLSPAAAALARELRQASRDLIQSWRRERVERTVRRRTSLRAAAEPRQLTLEEGL
jgi:hypothetical protein